MKGLKMAKQKDFDDFYSIGAKVVWDCERRFDEKHEKSFENFYGICGKNKRIP